AGAGNDLFVVNRTADVVQNSFASANDTIQASVSFSLPANVNTLLLTGTANIVGTGNAGNDSLVGCGGPTTLISGTGVDTLTDGGGATLFVINNPNDVIQSNGGTDTVSSSASYTLPNPLSVLMLTGSANLIGVAGGAFGGQKVIGNAGNDTLIAM